MIQSVLHHPLSLPPPPCSQVLPVNDEPPQLGGGLRAQLSCEEGGRVQLTVDYLSATDRDSNDSRLTYMLARSPSRGELQRSGLTTDKFSQQDLLQGLVYYVHSGGSRLRSGGTKQSFITWSRKPVLTGGP